MPVSYTHLKVKGRLDGTLPQDGELNPDKVARTVGKENKSEFGVPSLVEMRPGNFHQSKGLPGSSPWSRNHTGPVSYTHLVVILVPGAPVLKHGLADGFGSAQRAGGKKKVISHG